MFRATLIVSVVFSIFLVGCTSQLQSTKGLSSIQSRIVIPDGYEVVGWRPVVSSPSRPYEIHGIIKNEYFVSYFRADLITRIDSGPGMQSTVCTDDTLAEQLHITSVIATPLGFNSFVFDLDRGSDQLDGLLAYRKPLCGDRTVFVVLALRPRTS